MRLVATLAIGVLNFDINAYGDTMLFGPSERQENVGLKRTLPGGRRHTSPSRCTGTTFCLSTPSAMSTSKWNLALMADLLDRSGAVLHLTRHGWAYNPLPFARVGLFDRARAIIDDRPTVGADQTARIAPARGEEALAAGRLPEAIRLLQNGIDLVRARRHVEFYASSLSLARAWRIAGESAQALRVLEEAVRERPAYVTPGLAAAWWIKVQVHLARGYRRPGAGRTRLPWKNR